MRHFRYWADYALRFRSQLVLEPWMHRLVARLGTRRAYEGIEIVGMPTRKGETEPAFLSHTRAALRLIRTVDRRRFRRVQREIASVHDVPALSFGSYNRPARACSIDHARFDPGAWRKYPVWSTWTYAVLLVHEATHGAIYSRHVAYTAALRARIEKLCCEEARRFARRADRRDRRWSDTLVPPFDERRWHESWHRTWWQGAKELLARTREVLTDQRPPPGA